MAAVNLSEKEKHQSNFKSYLNARESILSEPQLEDTNATQQGMPPPEIPSQPHYFTEMQPPPATTREVLSTQEDVPYAGNSRLDLSPGDEAFSDAMTYHHAALSKQERKTLTQEISRAQRICELRQVYPDSYAPEEAADVDREALNSRRMAAAVEDLELKPRSVPISGRELRRKANQQRCEQSSTENSYANYGS